MCQEISQHIVSRIIQAMIMRKTILAAVLCCAAGAHAQHIAVLSDIHVSPGGANEKQLRLAVEEINNTPFDYVIMNGDLANEGSDAELVNVKAILDSIRHPLYVLPGNHESTWSQSATKTFVDLWGNDRFVIDNDSLVIIGISSGPFMKMGDGHVKQEDLHWLDRTLSELCPGGKRVLSFNHYPLLDDLDNMPEYVAILEKYPVIAHVNGHHHRWHRYNAGGDESGSTLPCVMVRALDARNGDYGYSVIDVNRDSIFFYNKRIGNDKELKYSIAAEPAHKKANFAPRPQPVSPDGFEVRKVWTDSASIFTRLAIDAQKVFFGNSLGEIRAVDKKTGTAYWSVPTGASLFSRPIILPDGDIMMPTHDAIVRLESLTGMSRKTYPSKKGPYVADGIITPDGAGYIQGAYCRIERRDSESGDLEWCYDSIFNYCQASPAIDGRDLVFGAWDTNLRCLDGETGKLRWIWNNGKTNNMLGPGNVVPAITGDKVFVVAPDRYMTALDRATGKELWRNNSHRFRESLGKSPDNRRIYAKTMDGELVAIDAEADSYKEVFVTDLGFGYDHAPCAIVERDNVIYSGSRRGKVAMVGTDGTLIASLPLGVSEVNGIDVDPHTGDIYVSLIEGTIYCIHKKR